MPHPDLVGPFPPGANPDEYDHLRRRVFWSMPSGIYLLGVRAGSDRNFMTTSWVTQLAREPKLLGVSVEREARTHELIERSRAFALSVVDREERATVRKFVKPVIDATTTTMHGVAFTDAPVTGSPVLASALAVLDCRLERAVELGTHTLFVGEVVDAHLADEAGDRSALRMEDTRMNYGG